MSWLTKLHQVLQVGSLIGGQVAPVIPGNAGSVLQTILAGVSAAEVLIPNDKPEVKHDVVQATTEAAHPEVSAAAISAAINQMVALLNQLHAAQQATPPAAAPANPPKPV